MIIDSSYLPPARTYSAATLTQIGETNYAPLATIGYGKETDPIVIENPSGAEVLPSGWGEVIAVVANGRSLLDKIVLQLQFLIEEQLFLTTESGFESRIEKPIFLWHLPVLLQAFY